MMLYKHWKNSLELFWHLIGDGDSRHICYKVEMPGAYEIASVSNIIINNFLVWIGVLRI